METYVLRKSVGSYSAGTRIEDVKFNPVDGSATCIMLDIRGVSLEGSIFDCPVDYVVKLRPRRRVYDVE